MLLAKKIKKKSSKKTKEKIDMKALELEIEIPSDNKPRKKSK